MVSIQGAITVKLHYSLFRCQLPDGVTKILNLEAISQISIEANALGKLSYWVFLLDGESVLLPEAIGHSLERAWSIFLTAKHAQHHAQQFIPNGIASFPMVKSALMVDSFLADAAHNAHWDSEYLDDQPIPFT